MSETIKSIKVRRRFNVGQRIWIGRMSGDVGQFVVTATPTVNGENNQRLLVEGLDGAVPPMGFSDWLSLADLGVLGYAYDDRPCQVHSTREAAEKSAVEHYDWWVRVVKPRNERMPSDFWRLR